jgi:hypothetical protein
LQALTVNDHRNPAHEDVPRCSQNWEQDRHLGIRPAPHPQQGSLKPCHTPSPSRSWHNLNEHRGRFRKGDWLAHGGLAILIAGYSVPAPVCCARYFRPWIRMAECMPKLAMVMTAEDVFKELEIRIRPFFKE